MHQATVRGFDIREAVFAWLDACNRKPKAELLQIEDKITDFCFAKFWVNDIMKYNAEKHRRFRAWKKKRIRVDIH